MWIIYAVLSALFAGSTAILAKIGMKGINSTLATAIRTFVVLFLAWGIVFLNGSLKEITEIDKKSWLFLILSGLATGGSWLFYFKAINSGSVYKVIAIDKLSILISAILAFIVLKEQISIKGFLGIILISIGILLTL